ncbi:MAG TPA: hypothetical protein VM576_07735 [Xanthomonadaceae bacterium]|nr:hypothetical protein [Xanthomonadaceae bacterium]
MIVLRDGAGLFRIRSSAPFCLQRRSTHAIAEQKKNATPLLDAVGSSLQKDLPEIYFETDSTDELAMLNRLSIIVSREYPFGKSAEEAFHVGPRYFVAI